MGKLLFSMPCLSDSKGYTVEDFYNNLFDRKSDKRYINQSIQRFISLNKRVFDFLGITVYTKGIDSDFTVKFVSSNYVGAIPVKMPYDGMIHKDLQVFPRFKGCEDTLAELIQLLSKLEYSTVPEFLDTLLLSMPFQLRPPLYYEAMKYLDLYSKLYKRPWVKFRVRENQHCYPKSNTNWEKYSKLSYDPRNTLIFSSVDNIFSTDHPDARNLKYVFDLTQQIMSDPKVPSSIRFQYQNKALQIIHKIENIQSLKTDHLNSYHNDPPYVKQVKAQGNILLQKYSTKCPAWRIDMAQLFERYVQHIVKVAVSECFGSCINNFKITGTGRIPNWGLKYLEPDIIVNLNDSLIMCDVKYKSNIYGSNVNSDILKDTHRLDLHQILAYCSFEPQMNKIGILFYPADNPQYRRLNYHERYYGIDNKIIICGLPFGLNEIDRSILKVRELFINEIIQDEKIV